MSKHHIGPDRFGAQGRSDSDTLIDEPGGGGSSDPWYTQIINDYSPTAAYVAEVLSGQTNQSDVEPSAGDTIRTIEDLTGNGYDLTERGTGAGAQLVANGIGSLHAWDFDFSDNEYFLCDINMNGATPNMFTTTKGTVILLLQAEDDEGSTSRIAAFGTNFSNGSSHLTGGRRESSDSAYLTAGFGAFEEVASALVDGVPVVMACRGDEDAPDRTTVDVGENQSDGTNFASALALGQKFALGWTQRSGYARWNGKIAACFCFNSYLSDGDVDAIRALMETAGGIS